MKPLPCLAAVATIVLAACAPKPENVKPAYTSQAPYENLSCDQIATESIAVSNKAHDAAKLERKHRRQDQAITATGLIVFWPALFFTHGRSSSADLAAMKGEMLALETASHNKNCGIVFNRS
jgi:hypothetical protein